MRYILNTLLIEMK